MSRFLIARPAPDEHAPYHHPYIDAAGAALTALGNEDMLALLEAQMSDWRHLLHEVTESRAGFAYAEGKWTLGESLVHVSDTERVFGYRLLRIARGDRTPLPGFEQDEWVPESRARRRSLSDILAELIAIRHSTLALVHSLDETALTQRGIASGKEVSARALVWMIAGHMAHHLELTRTKYLG
jgi:hypothetical protein